MILWTFLKNKNSRVLRICHQLWHHGKLKIHRLNRHFSLSHYQIMIFNIKSIQFNIAFNIKSILYTVNYMIIRKMRMLISNIHNITPNMVSYLQTCVEDFFNRIDFMKHQAKLCEQKLNQSVNTSDCQWSEARAPKASSRSPEKRNRQQRRKSPKMVAETLDKNQHSHLYTLNLLHIHIYTLKKKVFLLITNNACIC